MKWFKHASDANMNHKVQELILDHGVTGYGLYFYCLELIASGVCPDNVRFELRHDPRVIGRNLNVSANDVVQILDRCVELGLFDKEGELYTCPKMAEKTDDYTQKLTRKKNNSGVCPDKIRKSPPRLDKNRLDKNRLDKNNKTSVNFDSLELPGWVNRDLFVEFLNERKRLKASNSETAIKRLLNKLSELSGNNPVVAAKIIDESITNSWKGLFPLKQEVKPQPVYTTPRLKEF